MEQRLNNADSVSQSGKGKLYWTIEMLFTTSNQFIVQ
jgi:hypothetical protein